MIDFRYGTHSIRLPNKVHTTTHPSNTVDDCIARALHLHISSAHRYPCHPLPHLCTASSAVFLSSPENMSFDFMADAWIQFLAFCTERSTHTRDTYGGRFTIHTQCRRDSQTTEIIENTKFSRFQTVSNWREFTHRYPPGRRTKRTSRPHTLTDVRTHARIYIVLISFISWITENMLFAIFFHSLFFFHSRSSLSVCALFSIRSRALRILSVFCLTLFGCSARALCVD